MLMEIKLFSLSFSINDNNFLNQIKDLKDILKKFLLFIVKETPYSVSRVIQ